MNVILEAANLAGAISAFADYPLIAIGLLLFLALTRREREMGRTGRVFVWGFLVAGLFAYITDITYHSIWFQNLYWDRPLVQVWQKEFKNQTVPLDGLEYVECIFENVTFEYEGKGPTRFTNSKIIGQQTRIHTHNPVVAQTMTLVTGLGGMGIAVKPDQ